MRSPSSIERRKAISLAARHELWRRGDLSWKLTPNSMAVSKLFDSAPPLATVVDESSRKVGKSYLALCKAFEACIANPGQRVNYACKTGVMAYEVVLPLVRQVAADAPPELMPTYNGQTHHITFPEDGPAKGAYVVLFGCEDQLKADRGRGPSACFNVVDEAGFIPILLYVMSDVLKPQVIYSKGKTLLLSSPALSPGHEFCAIADAAQKRGLYSNRNVYTPGGLFKSTDEIEEYISSFAADLGQPVERFRKSSTYKREVLGQRAIDERLAVVPDWGEVENEVVAEWVRPPGFSHVDTYVSIDPGMSDHTGILFAYLDYLGGGAIVVEDELLLQQASTSKIASEVHAKEATLWPDKRPYLRVVDDIGKRLISDLWTEHKLSCSPLMNNDREAAINLLNVVVGGRKFRVHKRCVNLIRQLRNAIRVRPGGDMARSEMDGHWDLVAAAYHLTRHVERARNPYPPDWDMPQHMHRVGGPSGPRTHELSKALFSGTPLGRRMLKGRK